MNNIDIIRRQVIINNKIFRSTYLINYYAIFNGNFGRNGTKKIRVYDSVTNVYTNYDSVRDF